MAVLERRKSKDPLEPKIREEIPALGDLSTSHGLTSPLASSQSTKLSSDCVPLTVAYYQLPVGGKVRHVSHETLVPNCITIAAFSVTRDTV